MEDFLQPEIIMPILVFIAGMVFWYIRDKYKKKGKPAPVQKEGEVHFRSMPALIYDRTTTPYTWYQKELPPEDVKTIVERKEIGRQLNYMGKKVFRFYKILDASRAVCYEAVRDPVDVKNSPISSYIDMQHPYVKVLDDMTEDKNILQKYGHIILWAGIIAFLIVLIVTNK